MTVEDLRKILEEIEICYGNENIVLLNDFKLSIGKQIIDVRTFTADKFVAQLKESKRKTEERLLRINEKLEKFSNRG